MRQTILITGCSGQLGSRLSKNLSSHFNIISTYREHKNIDFKLDLTKKEDFDHIFSLYNPDIIINCSAVTDVDYCETNRNECREVNVLGLKKIINACGKKVKIIHISSDYVFDGLHNSYSEDSLTHPVNYYGKSKLEAENILIGSNRDYLIFRVSMLFDGLGSNFFTWVLHSLENDKQINVATDMISNPTWIDFFVEIIAKSIYLDLSGVFHYGSDMPISRFEFAKCIANKYRYPEELIIPVKSEDLDFVAKRPCNTSLDSRKISDYIDSELHSMDYILKLINK